MVHYRYRFVAFLSDEYLKLLEEGWEHFYLDRKTMTATVRKAK